MYLHSLPWQRVVGKMTQKKGGVLRSGRRRKGTIRIIHHAGPFRSGRFGFEARFLSKKLVLSIPSDFFDDLSHFGWNLTRYVFPMCFRNIWSLYIYASWCFLFLCCRWWFYQTFRLKLGRKPSNKIPPYDWSNKNDKFIAGWWFQACLFSISYKGWHPSHWRIHIFQDGYCTTNQL
jgi:hypothetical protein